MVSLGSWHLIWATRPCKVTRTHVCNHMNMITPTHCSCADSGFSYVGVQFGPDACTPQIDREVAAVSLVSVPIFVPALHVGERDAHAWPCRSWSILSSAVIATTHHLQSECLTSECALCMPPPDIHNNPSAIQSAHALVDEPGRPRTARLDFHTMCACPALKHACYTDKARKFVASSTVPPYACIHQPSHRSSPQPQDTSSRACRV